VTDGNRLLWILKNAFIYHDRDDSYMHIDLPVTPGMKFAREFERAVCEGTKAEEMAVLRRWVDAAMKQQNNI